MNLPAEKDFLEGVEYNLTSSEGLNKTYEVKVQHGKFVELVEGFFEEKRKSYSTKYFRVGKVPMSIVKKHFAASSFANVVSKMTAEILVKLDEKFLGDPDISVKQHFNADEKKDPIFNIILNTEPSVPDFDFKSIKIINPEVNITDEDIMHEMEMWAKNNERGVELAEKRASKIGDTVLISMHLLDKSSQSEKKSLKVKLGSGMFIDIEDKLLDKNEGDKIPHTIKIDKNITENKSLPSDMKKFAGKNISVNLSVDKIMETKNYEVNEEMAKKFGCSSIDTCKLRFKSMMEDKVDESIFMYKKHQLSKNLSSEVEFDIPNNALKLEIQILWNKFLARFNLKRDEMFNYEEIKILFDNIKKAGFLSDKTFDEANAHYAEIATRRIKFFFVMKKIQNDLEIKLQKEDVDKEIMKKSSDFKGGLAEAVSYYEKNKNARKDLENVALEDKIVAELVSKITLEDKKMAVKELFESLSVLINEFDLPISMKEESELDDEKSSEAGLTDESSSESDKEEKKEKAKKTRKPAAKKKNDDSDEGGSKKEEKSSEQPDAKAKKAKSPTKVS